MSSFNIGDRVIVRWARGSSKPREVLTVLKLSSVGTYKVEDDTLMIVIGGSGKEKVVEKWEYEKVPG